MSNQQDFEDRFSYANPAFGAITVSQQSEQQLAALSSELVVMAEMVRSFSILTRRKTLQEVFNMVTQHSDPRISLILAAARDKNDQPLFPNLDAVKAAMFGPASESGTEFLDSQKNIFVDGIRRVSAALSAAQFINQLAQLPEQHEHAKHIEKQGLEDLDRIIKVSDSSINNSQVDSSESQSAAFFFENITLNLQDTVQAEIYMPSVGLTAIGSGASWTLIGNYTGTLSTAEIVADISDKINELTLVTGTGNLLASPVLASNTGLHRIDVSARSRNVDVSYEVIIIKFTNVNDGSKLSTPFKWGVESSRLEKLNLNSALVSVAQGRVSSLSTAQVVNRQPNVIYFKRVSLNDLNQPIDYLGDVIPETEWQNGKLTYRVSPTQTENTTVDVGRLTSTDTDEQLKLDNLRYAQVALLLLNELFSVKGGTRTLGALIRNDDPTATDPLAGVELVAFSATNPETWMILDVLEIPPDILMAVGNLQGPLTQFSNKPRSIRIEAAYDYRVTGGLTNGGFGANAAPVIVRNKSSTLLNRINDQYRLFTGDCR